MSKLSNDDFITGMRILSNYMDEGTPQFEAETGEICVYTEGEEPIEDTFDGRELQKLGFERTDNGWTYPA
jgi:hypothetical protein